MKSSRFSLILRRVLAFILGEILLLVYSEQILKYVIKNRGVWIVFNFHNFSAYTNYFSRRGHLFETVDSKNFESIVEWLSVRFNILLPGDIESFRNDKVNITITFDDGYRDNYTKASPILKRNGVRAMFFVVTDFIGTTNLLTHDEIRLAVSEGRLDIDSGEGYLRSLNKAKSTISLPSFDKVQNTRRIMMNWSEINKLIADNHIISSHTASHIDLMTSSREEQLFEIDKSLKAIRKFGAEANAFAYPNGRYSDTTIDILESHQIKYGFTTEYGFNTFEEFEKGSMQIKRIGLNVSDSKGTILLKLLKSLI